jgi:hypothetical protein
MSEQEGLREPRPFFAQLFLRARICENGSSSLILSAPPSAK